MPDIPFPPAEWLLSPPFAALVRDSLGFVVEGDGSIPGEAGPVPTEFGLWWEFSAWPPGLGHTVGGETTWTSRIAQIRLVHRVGGSDLVTAQLEVNFHHVVWLWPVQLPSRIELWVAPGVTMNVHKVRRSAPP